jgi:hypothetical protein
MRKRLLFLALGLMLCAHTLMAQETTITNIAPSGFYGLKPNADATEFYAFYMDETAAANERFNVVVYNRDLTEIKRLHPEVAEGNELVAFAYNGDAIFFVFANAAKKTRTLHLIDRNGQMRRKVEEDNVPAALLKPEGYKMLAALNPDFVMVTSESRSEFAVQRYDANLEPGPKTKIPLDAGTSIKDAKVLNDILFLLLNEGSNPAKFRYQVQAINLAEGKSMYKTVVGEGSELGQVLKMNLGNDMNVNMAGMYFKDGDLGNSPEGIYVAQVDPSGNMKMYLKKNWEELGRGGSKAMKELGNGSMDVLFEDVVFLPENRYMLVGEVFEKNNGGAGTADFKVKEFILLNFGAEGDSVAVEKRTKPVKHATVRGNGATGNKYALASQLHEKHYFTLRTLKANPDRSKVVYRYDDNGNIKLKFFNTPDSTNEQLPDVDIMAGDDSPAPVAAETKTKGKKGSGQKQAANMRVYETEIDLGNYNDPELLSNLVQLPENRVMVTQYDSQSKRARIRILNIPG